ncbi:hypothetical protein diail_3191 [Diaporthe ilicicola]|nr:hypothetical protein diail_3191 [Diaporthe ilicicola]
MNSGHDDDDVDMDTAHRAHPHRPPKAMTMELCAVLTVGGSSSPAADAVANGWLAGPPRKSTMFRNPR